MDNIKRILVVSRLTQYCRDAVQTGISLARTLGADLQVLHLVSNPVDQEALNAPLPYPDDRHKSYQSIQQEEKEELEKVLRAEMRHGPIKLIVRDGDPAGEIVQVVKQERIDLMILLAHEEGRLEHLLFGRENNAIIRIMPCNILLVKREPEPIKW